MGTMAASRLATVAAWSTVSSMLAMSDGLADELSAQWQSGSSGATLCGVNRDRREFVLQLLADSGGAGARRFADGVSSSGATSNPLHSIPNIETLERNAPIRYVFRRQLADSGGPGRHRGGVTTESAFTIHKAPRGVLAGELHGSGFEPAMSHGLFGGFPGCNTCCEVWSASDAPPGSGDGEPPLAAPEGGSVRRLPPQGLFELDATTMYYCRSNGGGGLGDPLLRPPEQVLADVQAGLVSPGQARTVYGVVLGDGQRAVDAAGTAALRHALRAARLDGAAGGSPTTAPAAATEVAKPVRYDLQRGVAACAACGCELGPVRENWKARAVEHAAPLGDLGALMTSTLFVLRSYSCPGCGVLLDAEMTLPQDLPIHGYSPTENPIVAEDSR
jgi:N-methylhydantoinase B